MLRTYDLWLARPTRSSLSPDSSLHALSLSSSFLSEAKRCAVEDHARYACRSISCPMALKKKKSSQRRGGGQTRRSFFAPPPALLGVRTYARDTPRTYDFATNTRQEHQTQRARTNVWLFGPHPCLGSLFLPLVLPIHISIHSEFPQKLHVTKQSHTHTHAKRVNTQGVLRHHGGGGGHKGEEEASTACGSHAAVRGKGLFGGCDGLGISQQVHTKQEQPAPGPAFNQSHPAGFATKTLRTRANM